MNKNYNYFITCILVVLILLTIVPTLVQAATLGVHAAAPSEEWHVKFYHLSNVLSVKQTSDDGYILAGYTGNDIDFVEMDAYLLKIDRNGTRQWSNQFGEQNTFLEYQGMYWEAFYYESASSVQQTSDGGYILLENSDLDIATGMETYSRIHYSNVIKFDKNGKKIPQRHFEPDLSDSDRINPLSVGIAMQQTSDGGYILAGRNNGYERGYGAWLSKVDNSGNEQWSKTYGGSDVYANSVQQTSDGGYILAGRSNRYAWLSKVDNSGNEQWNKTYGESDVYANSVQQTSDGGYIVAGKIGDACLIKVDNSGNEQWSKSFGGSYDHANSVQQTSDGGYILAGKIGDACLIKVDNSGNEQWSKSFGGSVANSVQETSDGGYIVAGSDGTNGWAAKLTGVVIPVPGRTIGSHKDKIDIVFVPDKDYGSATDIDTWRPIFLTNINDQITQRLGAALPVSGNIDKFNFYYTTAQGDAEHKILPTDLTKKSSFADAYVILHTTKFGDSTRMGKPSIYGAEGPINIPDDNGRSFIHESGHGIFGLADEYDGCGTFYFYPYPMPNIWPTQDAGRAYATKEGWNPDDIQKFTNCQGDWWKLGTTEYIMSDGKYFANGWGKPAERRIQWVLNQFKHGSITTLTSSQEENSIWLNLKISNDVFGMINESFVTAAAPNYLPGNYEFTANVHSTNGTLLGEYGFNDPRIILAEPGYEGPTWLDYVNFQLILPYFNNGGRVDLIESATGNVKLSIDISQYATSTTEVTPPVPSIDIEKYVWNGVVWEDADTAPGPSLYSGPVKFKIVVTNTGNVSLIGVNVTDDKYGPVTLSNTTLAAGAAIEAEYNMTWASGQQVNTAGVEGYYGTTKYTDTDDAHYYGPVSQGAQYDNRLRESSSCVVFSKATYLDVGKNVSRSRDVLCFDLSKFNKTDTVSKATLSLFWYYPEGATRSSDTVVDIYRPIKWDPNYVTWYYISKGKKWPIVGGTWFDKNNVSQGSTPYGSVTFPAGKVPDNKYYDFDVTQLVQQYISGTYENTGFFLKARTESGNYIAFYSSDWTNPDQRPKLTVSLASAPAPTIVAPTAPVDEAPVAEAGGDQTVTTGSTVSFDGSKSTVDNGIVLYSWDFGDGTTSTGVSVTHSYTTAGTYTVTLNVTDASDQRDSDTLKVIANDPSSSTTPTDCTSLAVAADNRLRQTSPSTVYATTTYIDVGKGASTSRDVMLFDLSMYNKTDRISKATLSLYWYYPSGNTRTSDTIVEIYRPVEWSPKYVSWKYRVAGSPWIVAGGDWFDKTGLAQGDTPYASATFSSSALPDKQYHEFDVTELVQAYIRGDYYNTGFFIKAKTESGNNYIAFYSSDWSNAEQRPKLTITC